MIYVVFLKTDLPSLTYISPTKDDSFKSSERLGEKKKDHFRYRKEIHRNSQVFHGTAMLKIWIKFTMNNGVSFWVKVQASNLLENKSNVCRVLFPKTKVAYQISNLLVLALFSRSFLYCHPNLLLCYSEKGNQNKYFQNFNDICDLSENVFVSKLKLKMIGIFLNNKNQNTNTKIDAKTC